MICDSCGKVSKSNQIFCLNCGALLVDYENVKLDCLNYSLNDEDFLARVGEEFDNVNSEYEKIMQIFSNSLRDYTNQLNRCIEKQKSMGYKKVALDYSKIFLGLSESFDKVLDELSEVVFKMLSLSVIIWEKSNEIPELRKIHQTSHDDFINSITSLIKSIKNSKNVLNNVVIPYPDENFDINKNNLLLRFDRFVVFHESFVRELKFIKDKNSNNNYMGIEDNHNHFCIYCGAKLDYGQNFCSECGKPVFKKDVEVKITPSKYDEKISQLELDYDLKQSKAKELVGKLFDPNHLAYEKFNNSIIKSNNLFSTQLDITKKMAEMDLNKNPYVEKEIETKLNTLQTFIDKMEDLINELIIHMSSNKEEDNDINNLFKDMDDLIDSVKDY